MSERLETTARGGPPEPAAVDLLARAVDRLLAEDPVDLPGAVALERLRTLLSCAERLHAVRLSAVRDMDSRELYALDAAGSARGWLRRQPGGEDGQVTLARRLAQRPAVSAALADARIGVRGATQLCTALDNVPADLDDALVAAVVQDGIGRLLLEHTGGTPEDDDAAAAVLAQRAADAAVLEACCTDVTAAPAARVEPAFVLLAERLSPAELGSALRLLLDPLQPDGSDAADSDPYYLELRILRDGDVDIRGLLDPETGQSLAAEIERRLAAAKIRRTGAADQADLPSDVTAGGASPLADPSITEAPSAEGSTNDGASGHHTSAGPHAEPRPHGTGSAEGDGLSLGLGPDVDGVGGADPADPGDPADLADHADPADPADAADPTDPADLPDPADPADATDLPVHAEPSPGTGAGQVLEDAACAPDDRIDPLGLDAEHAARARVLHTAAEDAARARVPHTAAEPDLPPDDVGGGGADPSGHDEAGADDDDPLRAWDEALADADARAARRAAQTGGDLGRADRGPDAPLRLVPVGRQRHDALRDLLRDAASVVEPRGPAPCHLTVIATLDAVEGRLGALPAQVVTTGGAAVPLLPATLQRLGCSSVLDAVLLDASGNPVGASSTRRMPNRRERRAMRARWGSTCAVHGCSAGRTVPHHVEPWWLSGCTRLRDLVPLCASCHHDLHEGHRTLRLRDGRLIDDRGWVAADTAPGLARSA